MGGDVLVDEESRKVESQFEGAVYVSLSIGQENSVCHQPSENSGLFSYITAPGGSDGTPHLDS
jgi:hypothetical protein